MNILAVTEIQRHQHLVDQCVHHHVILIDLLAKAFLILVVFLLHVHVDDHLVNVIFLYQVVVYHPVVAYADPFQHPDYCHVTWIHLDVSSSLSVYRLSIYHDQAVVEASTDELVLQKA